MCNVPGRGRQGEEWRGGGGEYTAVYIDKVPLS